MTDNLIGGRYVLGPLLGRGGMAEVRRAHDTRLDRDVAVKRLRVDLAGDPVFQERFRREAHAAAGLNHPNIVSVFDTGESLDEASGVMIPYIVMELVVGHTLREILHDGRKIQPVRALEMTASVLDALDYSHRHGIIHRDIKPANVMLTSSGQVKVMDFGIARAVSDTAASMTQTASVIGTPQYLSPEQIRGEQVDRRSDIYSTGCLLYELLTGRPPFEGDSPVSLAYQHVRANPIPPSEIDPMVSTQMDAITLKALAKSPADRYQTAHAMEEDIERLLSGQKVQAQIPPPVSEDDVQTQVVSPASPTQVMSATRVAKRAEPTPVEPDFIDGEEEDEKSGIGKIIAICLGIILVIALVAVGLVWHFNRTPTPTPEPTPGMVDVPYVKTLTEDKATEAIEAVGLEVSIEYDHGANDLTIDTVTSQTPDAGESVLIGSTVTITVNKGPEMLTMPNVIGMNKDEALALLLKDFENVKLEASPTEAATDEIDSVVSSDPATGASITADTSITLYYATGQLTMPNVATMPQNEAVAALTRAGFTSVPKTETQPSTQAAGTVTNQNPAAGQKVSKDTPITLTIAVEIPATTAPPTTAAPTDKPTQPSGETTVPSGETTGG